MLFLGTITHQPDAKTAFGDFAAYVTTDQFLYSHLINSILGAAIGSIGVIGLMLLLQDSKVAAKAVTGMVATVTANILASSLFGVAAFAQPAMGRAFLAEQGNALDFYNDVYAAPLFLTALVFVLLFIIGGMYTWIAITRSGRWPRWIGWVYAICTTGFVLSNFLFPVGQSITSVFLFAATMTLAWRAGRQPQSQNEQFGAATSH
jgi:hypothetical protein